MSFGQTAPQASAKQVQYLLSLIQKAATRAFATPAVLSASRSANRWGISAAERPRSSTICSRHLTKPWTGLGGAPPDRSPGRRARHPPSWMPASARRWRYGVADAHLTRERLPVELTDGQPNRATTYEHCGLGRTRRTLASRVLPSDHYLVMGDPRSGPRPLDLDYARRLARAPHGFASDRSSRRRRFVAPPSPSPWPVDAIIEEARVRLCAVGMRPHRAYGIPSLPPSGRHALGAARNHPRLWRTRPASASRSTERITPSTIPVAAETAPRPHRRSSSEERSPSARRLAARGPRVQPCVRDTTTSARSATECLGVPQLGPSLRSAVLRALALFSCDGQSSSKSRSSPGARPDPDNGAADFLEALAKSSVSARGAGGSTPGTRFDDPTTLALVPAPIMPALADSARLEAVPRRGAVVRRQAYGCAQHRRQPWRPPRVNSRNAQSFRRES